MSNGQIAQSYAALKGERPAPQLEPPPPLPVCRVPSPPPQEWFALREASGHTWHVWFPGGASLRDVELWAWRTGYDVSVTPVEGPQ